MPDYPDQSPDSYPSVPGLQVRKELGRGGAGIVYLAVDLELQREVALKIPLGSADRNRFEREMNALQSLQHANIVGFYKRGEVEGRPYYTFEYVAGGNLKDKVNGTRLDPNQAAKLVKGLAEAIAYAHQRGYLHRDLKPENILLTTNFIPKVGDFGLATSPVDTDKPKLTQTGQIVGTPDYMAPEVKAGHKADRATDVWGLGVILYECLTGKPPSQSGTITEPIDIESEVPAKLNQICLDCLQQQPTLRPTAEVLATRLQRFLTDAPLDDGESAEEERPVPAWLKWLGSLVIAWVVFSAGWAATSFLWNSGTPGAVFAAMLTAVLAYCIIRGSATRFCFISQEVLEESQKSKPFKRLLIAVAGILVFTLGQLSLLSTATGFFEEHLLTRRVFGKSNRPAVSAGIHFLKDLKEAPLGLEGALEESLGGPPSARLRLLEVRLNRYYSVIHPWPNQLDEHDQRRARTTGGMLVIVGLVSWIATRKYALSLRHTGCPVFSVFFCYAVTLMQCADNFSAGFPPFLAKELGELFSRPEQVVIPRFQIRQMRLVRANGDHIRAVVDRWADQERYSKGSETLWVSKTEPNRSQQDSLYVTEFIKPTPLDSWRMTWNGLERRAPNFTMILFTKNNDEAGIWIVPPVSLSNARERDLEIAMMERLEAMLRFQFPAKD